MVVGVQLSHSWSKCKEASRTTLLVTLRSLRCASTSRLCSLGAPKKSMAEPLHIIKTEFCISSNSQNLYIIIAKEDATYGWWYTPTAMIYTPKCDDIPSLSQWIKNDKLSLVVFWSEWQGSNLRHHGPKRKIPCKIRVFEWFLMLFNLKSLLSCALSSTVST